MLKIQSDKKMRRDSIQILSTSIFYGQDLCIMMYYTDIYGQDILLQVLNRFVWIPEGFRAIEFALTAYSQHTHHILHTILHHIITTYFTAYTHSPHYHIKPQPTYFTPYFIPYFTPYSHNTHNTLTSHVPCNH